MGQSTDVALLNMLEVFEMGDPRAGFTRLSERPFSSEQKCMAVSGVPSGSGASASASGGTTAALNGTGREVYYVKGSIEAILPRCKFYYVSDQSTPGLDTNVRNAITNKAHVTASRGLRVIAMAYGYGSVNGSETPSRSSSPAVGGSVPSSSLPPSGAIVEKSNLVFVGFTAMLDPPRKGVADAISLLQSGGVQVVMITGDAEQTALSIARDLGLRIPRGVAGGGSVGRSVGRGGSIGSGFCLTGREIDGMSKAQLRERVGSVSVFARTSPGHKMRIVEAFQARGAVVAMTGDGGTPVPFASCYSEWY